MAHSHWREPIRFLGRWLPGFHRTSSLVDVVLSSVDSLKLERNTMTQIRPHVPDYAQSMDRAVHIQNSDDVLAYLRCFMPEKNPELREIAQRHFGRDHRNDWDSWLISLRATPVLWADGPVVGVPLET